MEMAKGNKKSIGRVVWNAGGKPSIMGILVGLCQNVFSTIVLNFISGESIEL